VGLRWVTMVERVNRRNTLGRGDVGDGAGSAVGLQHKQISYPDDSSHQDDVKLGRQAARKPTAVPDTARRARVLMSNAWVNVWLALSANFSIENFSTASRL
jgi:hypothetical protein